MQLDKSSAQLKVLLKEYFQDFFPAGTNKPKIAWCTSVGPSEILTALGFKVYFPENHGAILGATRLANKFIPQANAQGYSPDICSYLTSDIGSFLAAETPLTKAYGIPGIPKPDLLVYNTNQCHEVQDWFSWYARHFQCEIYGIHSPWKIASMGKDQIDYVARQFEGLIPVAERIMGKRLDIDCLRDAVSCSRLCSDEWKRFLDSAKKNPSPISFFDGCIQMAPAVMLRGTPFAVQYYKALNSEVSEYLSSVNTDKKPQPVRLYWDGMPIWGKLRYFSELFNSMNANVVASTYCNSWIFDCFDSKDPVRSLAEGYTKIFINRAETTKESAMTTLFEDFSIDGVVYHDAKTCPYNSNSRFGLPERLSRKTGIPHLIINGDLSDLRCFSEEQTTTSVETFVEQINSGR